MLLLRFALLLLSTDPPCAFNIRYPRIPIDMCGEAVIELPYTQGLPSMAGITFGPDGSVYVARPATREIVRVPADASGLIKVPVVQPMIFAQDLPEPPGGITYFEGAWYVSADTTITRLRDTNSDGTADEATVIVKDLPGGSGGWLGNVRVGPDRRLYVAKALRCDSCFDTLRGVLLSFALNGSDRKIVATGLRDSYDMAWSPDGELYIVDNERPDYPAELNLIPKPGSMPAPDFGWPRCESEGHPVQAGASCEGTARPVLTFPAGSHPTGMAVYTGSKCPAGQFCLLVALAGSWNRKDMTGYSVQLVKFDKARTATVQTLLPESDPKWSYALVGDNALHLLSFFPDHLSGLAVSREGWIYLSMSEGRLYRFRPKG